MSLGACSCGSRPYTHPRTHLYPWRCMVASMRLLNHPCPGRHHLGAPLRHRPHMYGASRVCVSSSYCSKSATGSLALGSSRSMWFPSSCPASASSARISRWSLAFSPMTKNVAVTSYCRSTARIRRVSTGEGLSSIVRAIAPSHAPGKRGTHKRQLPSPDGRCLHAGELSG